MDYVDVRIDGQSQDEFDNSFSAFIEVASELNDSGVSVVGIIAALEATQKLYVQALMGPEQ